MVELFREDTKVVGAMWRVVSEVCDTGGRRDVETRAGALALRGVGLVFGEGEEKE